jgi:hypothetical protein
MIAFWSVYQAAEKAAEQPGRQEGRAGGTHYPTPEEYRNKDIDDRARKRLCFDIYCAVFGRDRG